MEVMYSVCLFTKLCKPEENLLDRPRYDAVPSCLPSHTYPIILEQQKERSMQIFHDK